MEQRAPNFPPYYKTKALLLHLRDHPRDTSRVPKCFGIINVNRCKNDIFREVNGEVQLGDICDLAALRTEGRCTTEEVREFVKCLLCDLHAKIEYIEYYVKLWDLEIGKGWLGHRTPVKKRRPNLDRMSASAPSRLIGCTDITASSEEVDSSDAVLTRTPTRSSAGVRRRGEQEQMMIENTFERPEHLPQDQSSAPSDGSAADSVSLETSNDQNSTSETHLEISVDHHEGTMTDASGSKETLSTATAITISNRKRRRNSSDDQYISESGHNSHIPVTSDDVRKSPSSPDPPVAPSAAEIDQLIQELLLTPVTLPKVPKNPNEESGGKGCIYIFKYIFKTEHKQQASDGHAFQGNDPTILKIGKTKQAIYKRGMQIKNQCDVSVKQVYDGEQRRVAHCIRAEKLAQKELTPFRTPPRCRCQEQKKIEHCEWFEIPEQVALETVQIWRRFLQQSPYRSDGSLKPFWVNRIDDLAPPDKELSHEDHAWRHKRWRSFVSVTRWEKISYTFYRRFTNARFVERLLVHRYLCIIAILAVYIQSEKFGVVSGLWWALLLFVLITDLLE